MLRPHYREAAPVGILLHLTRHNSISSEEIKEINIKMLKMTVVQLGVLLLVICLSTQVVSQNTTITAATKSGTTIKITSVAANSTGNTTTKPTGAGVSLHAGVPSVLTPVIVAASLLQRYC